MMENLKWGLSFHALNLPVHQGSNYQRKLPQLLCRKKKKGNTSFTAYFQENRTKTTYYTARQDKPNPVLPEGGGGGGGAR